MLLRSGSRRNGRAAVRVLVLAASWCLWPEPAGAQPAPGGVVRDGWLARAVLAGATPAAAAAAEGPRWFTVPPQTLIGAAAGEIGSTPTASAAPAYDDYFKALGYSFTRGLVARKQLAPLAIGSAAALAFVPFDREASDALRGESTALCRTGEVAGHPITLGALSGGLILGSLASDDERFRSYAFALSQGLIVADSLTAAIKLAVPRTRPDGTSTRSFPSGHAAGSFALAAVSSHYYGTKAGLPLYALATLVAVSRVRCGKHFPTDVIVGAMVGYISARAAIGGTNHVTSGPDHASGALAHVAVGMPSLGPGAPRVAFYLRF